MSDQLHHHSATQPPAVTCGHPDCVAEACGRPPVVIAAPPQRCAFRALAVGTVFEFDHADLAVSCGGLAHGPWRKVSARTYDLADVPPHAGRGAYRVGTVAAHVRVNFPDCGRR